MSEVTEVTEDVSLEGVLDERFIQYFCRFDPPMVGVRFLVAEFRQKLFPRGNVHASDLQLSWCRHGDETWMIMGVIPEYEELVLRRMRDISLQYVSKTLFIVPGLTSSVKVRTIGYAPGHWFHPTRSKDKLNSLNRQALQEEEEEVYIRMFQKET